MAKSNQSGAGRNPNERTLSVPERLAAARAERETRKQLADKLLATPKRKPPKPSRG